MAVNFKISFYYEGYSSKVSRELALKNSIFFKFVFRKLVMSNGLNHLLHLTIAMVTIYTYLLHTHVLYVIFHVYYTT